MASHNVAGTRENPHPSQIDEPRAMLFAIVLALINLTATIFLVGAYLIIGNSLQQQALTRHSALVRSASVTIDRSVQDALFHLGSISLDSEVRRFLAPTLRPDVDLFRISEQLKRLKVNNQQIESLYVFRLGEPHVAVTENGAYPDTRVFPDTSFALSLPASTHLPLGPQRIAVRTLERPINAYGTEQRRVLTLAIPVNTSGYSGLAVMNIDTSWYRSLLLDLDSELGGDSALVYEVNGDTLLVCSTEGFDLAAIDGLHPSTKDDPRTVAIVPTGKTLVFESSIGNGLSVVHTVTLRTIFRSARMVRLVILIAWALLFGVSLPVAAAIRKAVYRPVAELYAFLRKHADLPSDATTRNEIEAIYRGYSRLADRTILYQRLAAEYKPLHDEVIVMGALLGRRVNRDAAPQGRGGVLDRLLQESFWCVLVEIDSYRHYSTVHTLQQRGEDLSYILKAIDSEIERVLTVSHLLEDRIVVLIPVSSVEDLGSLSSHLKTIRARVEDYLQGTVTLAVGSLAERADDLADAFHAAEIAIEQKFVRGKGKTFWARDIGSEPARDALDDETIKRLQQAVRALRRSQSAEVLKECLSAVIPGANLKSTYAISTNRIFVHLRATTGDQPMDLPSTGEVTDFIESAETIDELQTWFFTILNKIFHQIELSKDRRNEDYLKRIEDVIEEHYSDALLQISTVADVFNLSATYFGRFFHELTGTNFSNYVNETRLRHAVELLTDTDRTVKDIAQDTGFNSTQYFIRVFKKRFHTTPKGYRTNQPPSA